MKTKSISIALLAILLAYSCTYKIDSVKYKAGVPLKKNDLFYSLPKTILVLTVNYKILEKTKVVNGILEDPETEYNFKNVELKSTAINNPNELYVARGKNISHSFFLKENIDFKFNEKGMIQSLEANLEDKSIESADGLFKGVSAIVKSIALAGQGLDSYLQELNRKINKANTDLLQAISTSNEKEIAKYKSQLKSYYELLANYNNNNKEIIKESEKQYTFIIDPDQMTVVAGKREISFQPIAAMPMVKLEIEMNANVDNKSNVLSTGKSKDGNILIPGLVYNLPVSLKTKVLVSTLAAANQIVLENNLDFSQFGNLGFVPVTSKIFTSRKTSIEFNSSTGTLISYKTESGSSSENLSKSIENSANLLKTTIEEVKYDNKIEALKKQAELKGLEDALKDKPVSKSDSLKNSLDLLQLQFDIAKLQQEIDDMKKGKE